MFLLRDSYEKSGYQVLPTSLLRKEGIALITELLRGKQPQSALDLRVGKSTLINIMQPNANMETGSVSEKIKREAYH